MRVRLATSSLVVAVVLSSALFAQTREPVSRFGFDWPMANEAGFLLMRDAERAQWALPLRDVDARRSPAFAPRGPARFRGSLQKLRQALGPDAELQVRFDPVTGAPRHLFNLSGALSRPLAGRAPEAVLRFLQDNQELFGLSRNEISRLIVERSYTDDETGVTHVLFKQYVDGIEVFGGDFKAALDRNNQLVNLAGSLYPGLAVVAPRGRLRGSDALAKAVADVFPDIDGKAESERILDDRDQYTEFNRGRFTQPPWARLVWFPIGDVARLAWRVRLHLSTRMGWYDELIDAETGALLWRNNLYKFDSGRVFLIHPDAGSQTVVPFPTATVASPVGWTFGFSPRKTRGNNAQVGEDHGNLVLGGGSELVNFPRLVESSSPTGDFLTLFNNTYATKGVAQVTTFDLAGKRIRYVPNLPGFSTPGGGYDVSIVTPSVVNPNGATQLTTVSACNDCTESVTPANFSISVFGTTFTSFFVSSNGLITFGSGNADATESTDELRNAPRHTLAALWDDFNPSASAASGIFLDTFAEGSGNSVRIKFDAVRQAGLTDSNTFQITLHNSGAGANANVIEVDYGAVASVDNVIGIAPPGNANSTLWLRDFDVDAPIVGLSTSTQGIAEAHPSPDINAAITNLFYFANQYHDVLHRFGFTEAAGNFQHDNFNRGGAGLDPVLVSAQANAPVSFNNAFFGTPEDGTPGFTSFFLFRAPFRSVDSAFDGDVVFHELTHGLSNRLVGGPGNVVALDGPQAGAMGEGWSDGYSIVLTNNPVAGEYSTGNAATGIRRVAYNASPRTYHQFGNIFGPLSSGAMGIDPTIFIPEVHDDGEIWASILWDLRVLLGPNGFLRTVTDAMKLTPPLPSMLDARNAILLAHMLNGGTLGPRLINLFAARGMGLSATIEPAAPNDSASLANFATSDGFRRRMDPVRRVLYYDDFNGADRWTVSSNVQNLWHRTTFRSANPDGGNSWAFNVEATHNYNTGARVYGTLTSPNIPLPRVLANGNGALTLEFDVAMFVEGLVPFDTMWIRISDNNFSTFQQLSLLANSTAGAIGLGTFSHIRLNLSGWTGKVVRVQFYFDTLDTIANNFEGVYIDNLSVNMIGNDVRLMRNDPGRYLATSGPNNIGVWLPTTGQWVPFGGAAVTFGAPFDDAPVPADYNNDGITNLAVFRPLTGQWFVGEPGGFIVTFGNGSAGDLPAPGDYVTAGLDLIGIYRQPTAQWFVPGFANGFTMSTGQTDIPVVGDYDGDGKADMAQVGPDPTQGGTLVWRYRRSSDGAVVSTIWGSVFEHDIPVQGDFNGDGKTDLAVFRPLSSQWHVAGLGSAVFGLPTDVPVPADYNGDGATEIAVFRPMTGEWLVLGGPTTIFGGATDVPFGSKR